jgi:hypothetical protein
MSIKTKYIIITAYVSVFVYHKYHNMSKIVVIYIYIKNETVGKHFRMMLRNLH